MHRLPSVWALGLATLATSTSVTAQAPDLVTTCAAAGAVPVTLKGGPLKVAYDEFLDSTRVETKKWAGYGIGTSLELQWSVAAAGKGVPSVEQPVRLHVAFSSSGSRGSAQTAQARFSAASVLPLLVQTAGGTTRIVLAQPHYASRVAGDELEETMTYTVADSDLLTVATGTSARMRIAEWDDPVPGTVLEGARSLARARLCLRPAGEPAAPR